MEALRLTVTTRCPGGEGCRCRDHYGLAEYMLDLTGNDHGLPRTEPPLAPIPVPLTVVPDCTGEMTCECPRCEAERARRLSSPPKHPRQPWDVKAA